MDFDTIVTIICFVLLVVSYAVKRYTTENVYLTYQDQRIGGSKNV